LTDEEFEDLKDQLYEITIRRNALNRIFRRETGVEYVLPCRMKKIEMEIECPACNGTWLYQGMGEGEGTAVVCNKCRGTGAFMYSFSYNDFAGRKTKEGVKRIYLSGMGYKLGLGKVDFDGVGEIDMDKEGVSYREFLDGETPQHIKKLACPMRADQSACHKKEGFVDECNKLNGGWISTITKCRKYPEKEQCWKRFNEQ